MAPALGKAGSQEDSLSSSRRAPASVSCITSDAVNILVMLAARKTRSALIGVCPMRSTLPAAPSQRWSPRITPTMAPGAPECATSSAAIFWNDFSGRGSSGVGLPGSEPEQAVEAAHTTPIIASWNRRDIVIRSSVEER